MSHGALFNRSAVPPPVRIRRDINRLKPDDPIITYYRDAVGYMRRNGDLGTHDEGQLWGGLDKFDCWRYQAAIHGYPADPAHDPLHLASDTLPADAGTYWRACQHADWFFHVWHRMYVHVFERIVMDIIQHKLHGPADWALPYWNYSDAHPAPGIRPLALPKPFLIGATKPAAGAKKELVDNYRKARDHNPLFIEQRVGAANRGEEFLSPLDVNLDQLRQSTFDTMEGPHVRHHGGPTFGNLENTPHNQIHVAFQGFMLIPDQAALDPAFWVHHANIDRLWEVWVQRQKADDALDRNPRPKIPPDARSLWTSELFEFHGPAGPIKMTPQDVVNTRIAPLSYEYEDTSDPFA
jgi:tyrosinase